MSQTKPSLTRREVSNDVETGSSIMCRDKLEGYLITDLSGVRRIDGMNLIQALVRNVGPCCCDDKGKFQAVEVV